MHGIITYLKGICSLLMSVAILIPRMVLFQLTPFLNHDSSLLC